MTLSLFADPQVVHPFKSFLYFALIGFGKFIPGMIGCHDCPFCIQNADVGGQGVQGGSYKLLALPQLNLHPLAFCDDIKYGDKIFFFRAVDRNI